MQPFQCDLQAQIPKHPITTHTQAHPKQLEATVTLRQKKTINRPQPHPPHRRGTFHRRLQPLYTEKHKVSCSSFLPKTEPLQHHAAIPMRSASTDSKTSYNYAHTSTPKAAWSHRYRYLSSSPAATLHGKTQGFVLRLPPQNRALATSCATPLHGCQFPSSPLPFIITSLPLHFPSSPLPFLTTSLRHHSPSSSLPFFTASLRHHFPSSPLPFLTTSLRHHSPSSSLPFFTTSLRHHFPSSPLPFVTTPLHHHFPSSPLPFVTTCLPHHFPSSPLPFLTTPIVTTSLRHHFPSSPPVINCFLFFCYVLLCDLPPCIISSRRILFVRNTEVLLPNFLWSYRIPGGVNWEPLNWLQKSQECSVFVQCSLDVDLPFHITGA